MFCQDKILQRVLRVWFVYNFVSVLIVIYIYISSLGNLLLSISQYNSKSALKENQEIAAGRRPHSLRSSAGTLKTREIYISYKSSFTNSEHISFSNAHFIEKNPLAFEGEIPRFASVHKIQSKKVPYIRVCRAKNERKLVVYTIW